MTSDVSEPPQVPQDRPEPPAGPPVCYRHPDREAHIRCARCGKRVCPDCMVSAAVGFQCPDCVLQGRRTQRPARTVAGGRENRYPALVTRVLMGINLVVFVLGAIIGQKFITKLFLIGSAVDSSNGQVIGVAHGEWYRLITATFLHQALWHIAANMISLWFIGPPLERFFGHTRFLVLYLVSALSGSALSYLLLAQNAASLGASGAIFGLLGALLVVLRRLNLDMRPAIVILVINLAFTFANMQYIDWRAHVGGLVGGALTAAGFSYAPRAHRTIVQVGTVVVVLGAVLAIDLLRTAQLT